MSIKKGYAEGPYGQVHFAHNDRRDRPALVLLGPAPRSWRAFEQVFPLLDDAFHLIAPDPPCFGASDALPEDATMYDVAEAVVEVLNALEVDKAHVYGHNTGRLIAAAIGDKFQERVDRMIIAGPTFTLIPEQDIRIAAIRGFVGPRYFDGNKDPAANRTNPVLQAWASTFRSMIAPWWWTDDLFTTPEPAEFVTALENRIIDELMSRRSVELMYRMNFAFDMADALRRVRAETRIIEIVGRSADAGGFDRQGRRLAAQMPHASAMEMRQTEDAIGLFLLCGLEPMCAEIKRFLRG